jgi:esterase/lipase superfamily enzyme
VAQVATDVGTDPMPVLFSWPSQGDTWFSTAKYTFDENAAARSAMPFAWFLGSLLAEHEQPIDLVAHSMGSRVVADGLVDLHRNGGLARPLDQLVFAAPDVDATVFAQRYHQTVLAAAERVTVYCADDDRALKLSRKVHGGYDRLGSCRTESLLALTHDRFDVVDASRLYVDLMDHDKVTSSPRLLEDLALVLHATPIEERPLEPDGPRHRLPP